MKTATWQPIESAPKDGTRFLGLEWRKHRNEQAMTQRETWYGKASHVPLYGWCHGKAEDVDLWQPTHWKPHS